MTLARKSLGYVLLAWSIIGWGIAFLVPFIGFDVTESAAIVTGLIISTEVAFTLSVLLLGREVWERMKGWFVRKDTVDWRRQNPCSLPCLKKESP
jgi:hypothetical protein